MAHRSERTGRFCYTPIRDYTPVRELSQGRFSVSRTVGDGAGGVRFSFFVFELDQRMSEFLAPVVGGDGGVSGDRLPPGVEAKSLFSTVSAADPKSCG